MHTFNKVVLAMAFMGVSVMVQAADRDYPGPFFGKAGFGKPGSRMNKTDPHSGRSDPPNYSASIDPAQLRHNGWLRSGQQVFGHLDPALAVQPFGLGGQAGAAYQAGASGYAQSQVIGV